MDKEHKSLIKKELERFEKQIEGIYVALESINLMDIDDVEARLKAAVAKQNVLKGLPVLLTQLEELRTKNKLKADDIKGSKTLSPLDDGTLD